MTTTHPTASFQRHAAVVAAAEEYGAARRRGSSGVFEGVDDEDGDRACLQHVMADAPE